MYKLRLLITLRWSQGVNLEKLIYVFFQKMTSKESTLNPRELTNAGH